ncbi:ketoacyl-ACP synthase III family protein [Streptomyces sp. TLI_171]|uniref:ketoacyl-ACP synthase III family protein n=1 Tax=Streptomyces sp. TLI_171 TaxID=1938859 RepID=UPI000C18CFC2|nr:ketoacyl-ACP synthase III family protein [Streptomyces sp. TLI_171]RKE20783.1 3-oxoacyl-[acyl-carrier-protein] synthase-3 [Streptomyces sp. TLI_171]
MNPQPGIGIAAVAAWYPEGVSTAEDALADGLLGPDELAKLGTRRLPVAEIPPPDAAVEAGRLALAGAGLDAAELGLVLHAWIYHQGHDFWSPPHYLAHRLGADRAFPLGIQQMCNGGPAAVQTAVAWLTADPGLGHALVTTADSFCGPGFDRWRGDYGVAYGDAATALLLHAGQREDDVLHLLAVAGAAAPELESVHRGDDPFSPAPRWHGPTVDVRRPKKAFLAAHGPDRLFDATRECVDRAVRTALDRAGLTPDDPQLRHVMLPRLGKQALDAGYRPAVAFLAGAEVHDLGPGTGHLGAGDTAANLADLVDRRLLAPGELAVAVSGGAGFTWSAAVVRAPRN